MADWTWIDEDSEMSEDEIERITPTLNALATEWNQLTREIESDGWARQSRMERGWDDEPDCDNEGCSRRRSCAECKAARVAVAQLRVNKDVKLEIIEEMLARHGARMMRPYEHWNEDERYMEYMENRADY